MELQELQNFLDSVPNINDGGCGISAYVLGYYLANKNIDFSFVFLDDDEESNFYNNRRLLGISTQIEVPSHVCLRINNDYIDSRGKMTFCYAFRLEGFTFFDLIDVISSGINWNPAFDREKWIPEIQKFSGI